MQKLGPRRLLRLGLRDAQSRIHQIHVYDAPAEGAAVRLDQLHHVAETALIPLYMSPCKAKEYLMLVSRHVSFATSRHMLIMFRN